MTSLRIASQLGEEIDQALLDMLTGVPVELVSVPKGAMTSMPEGTQVLLAFPFALSGKPNDPRPAGWPFDVSWVQLMTAGSDLYPAWLLDGPTVTSASGSLATPIAEFCLALIFAAAKQVPQVWIHKPDDWRFYGLKSVEGASLGIFGFGAIGEDLARRALALGMKVHAVRQSDQPMLPGVTRLDSMEALMAASDHVVLAAPATEATRHIVNADTLGHARPGLHLINIARATLIHDEALLKALDDDVIGLASLDVADPEPLPAGHPFYSHPRVRLSPHTSAMAQDVQVRIARLIAANIRRFVAGEPLMNVVKERP